MIIIAVLVPRGSSAAPATQLPAISDEAMHEIVRDVLVRAFGRRLPGAN